MILTDSVVNCEHPQTVKCTCKDFVTALLTCTVHSISSVAKITSTVEASFSVRAGGIVITVVQTQ